jgi:hypothetical protein
MSTKGSGTYTPRRSQHVSSNVTASDGDVWQEKLAVCEGTTPNGEPKLVIRSFYRNARSGDRVWDEPPSGAGSVVHATSQMRKKAEMQKVELQLTLEMIPSEEVFENNFDATKTKKEKVGLLGRFRSKKKDKKEVETSKDLNLQRAIARSIADQTQGCPDEPIVHYDGEKDVKLGNYIDEEDEAIALAKALSISEAAVTATTNDGDALTEEEMFQRALEQSKKYARCENATGVASLPNYLEDESTSSFSMSTVQPLRIGKRDPNESSMTLPE